MRSARYAPRSRRTKSTVSKYGTKHETGQRGFLRGFLWANQGNTGA